jgi:hypothetical protein
LSLRLIVLMIFSFFTQIETYASFSNKPLKRAAYWASFSFKYTGLFSYILDSTKTYRQSDCFDLSLQMDIYENCKCYYLQYPKVPNTGHKILIE